MKKNPRILLVDEDHESLALYADLLRADKIYEVICHHNGSEAEAEIKRTEFDVIVSSAASHASEGKKLVSLLQAILPQTEIIVIKEPGDVIEGSEMKYNDSVNVIEKPLHAEHLKTAVDRALNNRNHKKSHDTASRLSSNFLNIVGSSAVMRELFDLIRQVAASDANVTVHGESGTGKELVARAIHAYSRRNARSFVPVNCGAFPEHLFESELFGHEKGAFTGAYRKKPGLIEYADGGTFFLDEICELNLPLQVKLLRLLQDKKIRHVGGTELIDVDVRIISASNRNLQEAVSANTLREDLYYRLNVISISIPPLRDRLADLPELCEHFIRKFAKTTPKEISGISEAALDLLMRYRWPGNVRELENVIERAIALANGELIEPADLPSTIAKVGGDDTDASDNEAQQVIRTSVEIPVSMPLKDARDIVNSQFERAYIDQKLADHRGNITQAAEASGINRRTFHRLLKRYQINPKNAR